MLISLITLRVALRSSIFFAGGIWIFLHYHEKNWASGCAEGWREKAEPHVISFGYGPFPVTVTTRIIPFLVGNPNKPFFATVTGKGPRPTYHHVQGYWRIQFDGKVWLSILTLASKKFQSSSSDILRPSEKNLSSKRWMLLWKDGVLWWFMKEFLSFGGLGIPGGFLRL